MASMHMRAVGRICMPRKLQEMLVDSLAFLSCGVLPFPWTVCLGMAGFALFASHYRVDGHIVCRECWKEVVEGYCRVFHSAMRCSNAIVDGNAGGVW